MCPSEEECPSPGVEGCGEIVFTGENMKSLFPSQAAGSGPGPLNPEDARERCDIGDRLTVGCSTAFDSVFEVFFINVSSSVVFKRGPPG